MRRLIAVIAAATLALAACGGDDDAPAASGSAGAGKTDQVKVGVIPILDVAPIYLGQQKGFFKQRNIELELELAQGGAAITPAVVSGQYQFGFSNVTSLLIGREKNLPVVVVSAGAASTGKVGADFGGLVVKSPDIKDAAGLVGKKVAVNTLNNIGDTVVRRAVTKAGGDASKIQFVEMPFPDMPAALDKGNIDGAFIVEPFLTATTGAGARIVSSVFAETDPKLPVGVYFTTEKMRTDKPDLVKRFAEAMKQSQAYAQDHPDEARQILTTYTKIAPETIAKVVMPAFPQEVDQAALKVLADLAKQDGLITKDVDLEALLAGS
jgi:NitT/TauT family transport system substrate-binding protein